MAKRWKLIRTMLANVGYTSIESAADITIQSIDADGWITYLDQNGDQVKAQYNSTIPIVVDSDTETIIFDSQIYLAGLSAATYTYAVTNENGLDVTSEITFTSTDATIATTGGTNGRVITAVQSGTTTVTLYHEDWISSATTALASGQTNVIVGVLGTGLVFSPTALTMLTGSTYSGWTILFNENGVNVPNEHVSWGSSPNYTNDGHYLLDNGAQKGIIDAYGSTTGDTYLIYATHSYTGDMATLALTITT